MRDINRIDRFLSELRNAWMDEPDLRFGQLMGNIFSLSDIDFFYQEDDLLLENIRKFRNLVLAENFQAVEKDRADGKPGCSMDDLSRRLGESLAEDTPADPTWNAVEQLLNGPYHELHAIYEPNEHGWYCAAVDLFQPGMTFRLYFEVDEENKIEVNHLERWFFG